MSFFRHLRGTPKRDKDKVQSVRAAVPTPPLPPVDEAHPPFTITANGQDMQGGNTFRVYVKGDARTRRPALTRTNTFTVAEDEQRRLRDATPTMERYFGQELAHGDGNGDYGYDDHGNDDDRLRRQRENDEAHTKFGTYSRRTTSRPEDETTTRTMFASPPRYGGTGSPDADVFGSLYVRESAERRRPSLESIHFGEDDDDATATAAAAASAATRGWFIDVRDLKDETPASDRSRTRQSPLIFPNENYRSGPSSATVTRSSTFKVHDTTTPTKVEVRGRSRDKRVVPVGVAAPYQRDRTPNYSDRDNDGDDSVLSQQFKTKIRIVDGGGGGADDDEKKKPKKLSRFWTFSRKTKPPPVKIRNKEMPQPERPQQQQNQLQPPQVTGKREFFFGDSPMPSKAHRTSTTVRDLSDDGPLRLSQPRENRTTTVVVVAPAKPMRSQWPSGQHVSPTTATTAGQAHESHAAKLKHHRTEHDDLYWRTKISRNESPPGRHRNQHQSLPSYAQPQRREPRHASPQRYSTQMTQQVYRHQQQQHHSGHPQAQPQHQQRLPHGFQVHQVKRVFRN